LTLAPERRTATVFPDDFQKSGVRATFFMRLKKVLLPRMIRIGVERRLRKIRQKATKPPGSFRNRSSFEIPLKKTGG
jgi:hypothetical protein